MNLQISSRAFWDVKIKDLDEKIHANFIIVRVFERGTLDDFIEVLCHYGDEKIKNTLLQTPYLMEQNLLFAANLFNLDKTQFKCYTTKQYHRVH